MLGRIELNIWLHKPQFLNKRQIVDKEQLSFTTKYALVASLPKMFGLNSMNLISHAYNGIIFITL